MNLRNQQKFGMINELKIRPASVENKNEQKVSVIPEMGQASFFFLWRQTVRNLDCCYRAAILRRQKK